MSVLGTGVAAGVANVAAQAGQVARQQNARAREDARVVRGVKDTYESHQLRVEDESGAADAETRLAVDDQKQEGRQGQQREGKDGEGKKPASTQALAGASGSEGGSPELPRPRLDVTA